MANRYAQRPRAPSPPRSPTFDNFNILRRQQDDDRKPNVPKVNVAAPQLPPARRPLPTTSYRSAYEDNYDTDNTYSVVQDDQTVEFLPPTKTPNLPSKIGRMFGDSEAENDDKKLLSRRPNGSLSSNASSNSSLRGGSLSSLYQARKSGLTNYDSATVEQIKAQFQAQIESMLQSQERNNRSSSNNNNITNVKVNNAAAAAATSSNNVKNGHIPSTAERELNGIRELQRGKSFVEARTAVQKQIERMFSNAQTGANAVNDKPTKDVEMTSPTHVELESPLRRFQAAQAAGSSLMTNPHNGSKILGPGRIQHTMHGVSHALPGEELDIEPPPPVHYGVDQALRNGSVALKSHRSGHQQQQQDFESVKNFFSNDDLRNVGRSDAQTTSTFATKSPALKRLTQSHDSLVLNEPAERVEPATAPSFRSKSREEISVQTDRQHLGNIDVSSRSSSTSQPRLSRSTDTDSPSSAKTGWSSLMPIF